MNSHNKKNISNQIIKIPSPKPIFYNQLNKKHTITKKSALVTNKYTYNNKTEAP